MDRKTIIMLDLIRIINILNISLLLGIFLSWLGINRYLVFIVMLFCCALLSYFTQKSFTSKYGLYNSLAGSTVFVIVIILTNVCLLAYYIFQKEYVFVSLFLVFFFCYSFFLKKRAAKRKQWQWRIENV